MDEKLKNAAEEAVQLSDEALYEVVGGCGASGSPVNHENTNPVVPVPEPPKKADDHGGHRYHKDLADELRSHLALFHAHGR